MRRMGFCFLVVFLSLCRGGEFTVVKNLEEACNSDLFFYFYIHSFFSPQISKLMNNMISKRY